MADKKLYRFLGQDQTIEEIAEISGVPESRLRRLIRKGRSPEEAVLEQPCRQVYVDGELVTVREAARKLGVSTTTVYRALRKGEQGEFVRI